MPTVEDISELLRKRITLGELPPNSWLPTAQSLAAELATSRLTVRKAIDQLVDDGLLKRREGAGILVTDSPLAGTSVLYVGLSTEHLHKDIHGALLRQAQAHGFRFLSFHWPSEGGEPNLTMLQREVKSADWLVVDVGECAQDVLCRLPESRPPTVVIGPYIQGTGVYHVLCWEDRGVQLLVDRLVELGHRDFLYMTHALLPEFREQRRRNPANGVPSFLAALEHYELRERCEMFYMCQEPDRVHVDGLKQVLGRRDRPTAVVCEGDYRARHVYVACAELGLSIPTDLSVTGLGNTPWSHVMLPSLTTVSYEEETLAWMALSLVESRSPTAEPFSCAVEPRLIVRDSIGPCPR